MRIGPFYFDTKELFLIAAIIFLGLALYFDWQVWHYESATLLTLAVIMLMIKGLMRSIHNDVFFFHSVATLALALFLPLFQVVLFYLVTFFVLRLVKAI